jgi:hypothetical protein
MVELSPAYCHIVIKRFEKLTGIAPRPLSLATS